MCRIGCEKPNTAGITKTLAPQPDPEQPGGFLPNGAAAKAGLNKRIPDGHIAKENRVTRAKFECVKCGFVENADTVGALNVLRRAGLVLCDAAQPAIQESRRFSDGWSHDD